MEIVIASVISFFGGFFIGRQFLKGKGNKEKEFSRRGILDRKFDVSSRFGSVDTIEVQFEIGELEATDTKSKVKVISLTANKSEYNNTSKSSIRNLIDNTWIQSSDIDWIKEPISETRNKKIDKLLN